MHPVQNESPLRPQPGSQIDPSDAVGRTGTTARARRELDSGNNLLLNDPRRMGKTVWLDLFCADPGAAVVAVKIDYEGVRSRRDFLLRTVEGLSGHRSMPAKALEKFRAPFENRDVAASVCPISVKPGDGLRSPTAL